MHASQMTERRIGTQTKAGTNRRKRRKQRVLGRRGSTARR